MAKYINTDSYGSARWANVKDLHDEGLFGFGPFQHNSDMFNSCSRTSSYLRAQASHSAFVLGKLQSPSELLSGIRSSYESSTSGLFSGLFDFVKKSPHDSYLGWKGDGHIITIAPTRSGKGVGLVIPNLLHYPGSVLVIDPKGENYAVTHDYRSSTFKQDVVCLDPFRIVSDGSGSINPLDGLVKNNWRVSEYLEKNPELLDDAGQIADAMIYNAGAEPKDPHWDHKARSLLKCLILAVICGKAPNNRRHLSKVREILTSGQDALESFLQQLAKDPIPLNGMLARAANEIMSASFRELSSIISTALRHTEFLDSPLVCNSLGSDSSSSGGSYDISQLKQEGKVSIYMVMPPHHLPNYVRCIRLWITMAMKSMTSSMEPPADGCPVLFMLDEMAQLGTMNNLRQAVSLLAGYGMTIWMIWQDLSQLKSLYEHDWPSFLANAKIQQYFGINDQETAKHISEMLGMATIHVASLSSSENYSRGLVFDSQNGTSKGQSVSEISRALLNPDEVRRLNRETVITFIQGAPPILNKRISYYKDAMFAGRARPNPYFSAMRC